MVVSSAVRGPLRQRGDVNVRFAQLAELRNRLRHSRAVDDVTRKDGEAALLWFQQVLAISDA